MFGEKKIIKANKVMFVIKKKKIDIGSEMSFVMP